MIWDVCIYYIGIIIMNYIKEETRYNKIYNKWLKIKYKLSFYLYTTGCTIKIC